MFIESWILQVSCKVNVKPFKINVMPEGFTLILQETRIINVSMDIQKILLIFKFYYKYIKYKVFIIKKIKPFVF